ncbi:MAG: hypothetical protein DCC71_02860 [Proteobacteria bacterium]|nr:MAG: hypothetical protein DCC71_02860 [Pseudomonadota bacterium]
MRDAHREGRSTLLRRPAPLLALVAFAIGTTWSAAVHARAFQVACDVSALYEAMNEASANGEEDVLWLARSCQYPLTGILIAYPDGGFALTVQGNGSTISGQNQRTAFLVNPGATLFLNDVTVTQGRAGPTASGDGGAIYNAGSLTLTRSTVSDSVARSGGGIFNVAGASLTLIESTVAGNTAGENGGGIRNQDGRLTLIQSTVSGNAANGQNGMGGGVYNEDTSGMPARATATLSNCTISGNASRFGAGLMNDEGKATVSNCTLADNTTVGGGNGGGIYHRNYSGNARLRLGLSILANTQGGGLECARDPSVPSNAITPTGDNLVEDASCQIANSWSGDPKLGELTGSPAYRPLLAGSPVIDLGQNTNCAGVDQRGAARPKDGNADGSLLCDLGAFEAP